MQVLDNLVTDCSFPRSRAASHANDEWLRPVLSGGPAGGVGCWGAAHKAAVVIIAAMDVDRQLAPLTITPKPGAGSE